MSNYSDQLKELFSSYHPKLEVGELVQYEGHEAVYAVDSVVSKLLEVLPHQSGVPGLQLDAYELFQHYAQGTWPAEVPPDLVEMANKAFGECYSFFEKLVGSIEAPAPVAMWNLKRSTLEIGRKAVPRTSGPGVGSVSAEEALDAIVRYGHLGIQSEDALQPFLGDPDFVNQLWTQDEMHTWATYPTTEMVAKVPQPAHHRMVGGRALGFSYKKEEIVVRAKLVVKSNRYVGSGLLLNSKQQKLLRQQFRNRGMEWTPLRGIPHMITEKIDGTAIYMASEKGKGYMVSRSGDKWEFEGLPDCAMGFEFYSAEDGQGMFLTHLDHWKFENVTGLEQLVAFGQAKTFKFIMTNHVVKAQTIEGYCIPAGRMPPFQISFDGWVAHYAGDRTQRPDVFVATCDLDHKNMKSLVALWGGQVIAYHSGAETPVDLEVEGATDKKHLPSYVCEYDFERQLSFEHAPGEGKNRGLVHTIRYCFDRPDKEHGNTEAGLAMLANMPGAYDMWHTFIRYWIGVIKKTAIVEVEDMPEHPIYRWQLERVAEYKKIMLPAYRNPPTGKDRPKSYKTPIFNSYE